MTSGRPTGLRLAVVPGDGIGPEVVAEGLRVLEAVCADEGVKLETTDYDLSLIHISEPTRPY